MSSAVSACRGGARGDAVSDHCPRSEATTVLFSQNKRNWSNHMMNLSFSANGFWYSQFNSYLRVVSCVVKTATRRRYELTQLWFLFTVTQIKVFILNLCLSVNRTHTALCIQRSFIVCTNVLSLKYYIKRLINSILATVAALELRWPHTVAINRTSS